MDQKSVGAIFAFLSSVFNSSINIIAKHLLQHINQAALMSLWFVFASFFTLAIAVYAEKKSLLGNVRRHWRAGIVIAFTNIFAAALFFASIAMIGPSPTAFLAKLDVIFIVVLAFVFLKERLNLVEAAGIAIAILGSFVFAFSSQILAQKAYIGVLLALSVAINTAYARYYSQKISVALLQLYRTVITAIAFVAFALATGQFFIPKPELLGLIAIGSILSAVVGIGLFYAALQRIRASIVSIIRNLDPFLVAIYAYFAFHTLPTVREWAGGIVIVAGVTITIFGMNSNHSKLFKKFFPTRLNND